MVSILIPVSVLAVLLVLLVVAWVKDLDLLGLPIVHLEVLVPLTEVHTLGESLFLPDLLLPTHTEQIFE